MNKIISVPSQNTQVNDISSEEYYLYDNKFIAEPFGLTNMGSSCWYNSIIQTLLSLPAFNRTLLENENDFTDNILAYKYIQFIKQLMCETKKKIDLNGLAIASVHVWNGMLHEVNKNKKTISTHTQEGAANGLCVFIELLNAEIINCLFNNRYRYTIECPGCKEIVSATADVSPIINIYSAINFETQEDFQNYIKSHYVPVDTYECEKCKNKYKNLRRLERLTMLREIIVIVFQKNTMNKWYPEFLEFTAKNNKKLKYKLVSQIEHSGGYNIISHMSGGHYWAQSLRNNKWYTLNDTNVSAGKYNPNNNSHIAVYHMYENV